MKQVQGYTSADISTGFEPALSRVGRVISPDRIIECHRTKVTRVKTASGDIKVYAENSKISKNPLDVSWLANASETYDVSPNIDDYVIVALPIVTPNIPNRNMDCLVGSSLVPTNVGLVRLDKIPKSGATHVLTTEGPCKIRNWRKVGYLPTVKVTLRDGRVLRGTEDHEIMVIDRATMKSTWRALGDLSPSDYVVCQTGSNFECGEELPGVPSSSEFLDFALEDRNDNRYSRTINEVTAPTNVTPELSRLLGYLVSEGSVMQPNNVGFSNNDAGLLDDFCLCWKKTFGLTIEPTYESDSGGYAYGSSVIARQWLDKVGLKHRRAKDKRIPWSIMRSSTKMASEFLRAYAAGDGCVSGGKIIFGSSSYRLLGQVQCLLMTLGVHSKLTSDHPGGPRMIRGMSYDCNPTWRLVLGKDAAKSFVDCVGVIPGAKGLIEIAGAKKQILSDLIPFAKEALTQLVADRRVGKGPDQRYMYRTADGLSVPAYLSPGSNNARLYKGDVRPLLDTITSIDSELGSNLEFLCREDISVGEVVSSERASDEWVYDIGVENAHHFIANGVVVHNCFPFHEMAYFNPILGRMTYQTFIGKPTHIDHVNQDPKRAKGVHFDATLARWDHNKKFWKISVLTGWDRTKDSDLVDRILSGERSGYSMGALVDHTRCSVCKAVSSDHVKCQHFERVGKGGIFQGNLVYDCCHGVNFIETSSVGDPADPFAVSNDILGR